MTYAYYFNQIGFVGLASKAGINRNTLTALELGKPGTAIGVCFTVPKRWHSTRTAFR
jgi:hypothetical protein